MSEPEIVNPVGADEIPAWSAVSAAALLQPLTGDRYARRLQRFTRTWRPDRSWGARVDGRWVGNLLTEPRSVTVPAGAEGTRDLAADAVTAVGVAATHRRQGLLRRMISSSLAAAAGRGDPVSMLWAAEWPIYGRYGYAPATTTSDYTLWTRRPNGLLDPPRGVLQVATADELRDIAPRVYDTARVGHAGEIDRPDPWWPRLLGLDGFRPVEENMVTVVHRGADGADGLLFWRPARQFGLRDDMGSAEVLEFVATNDAAYRDLWAYLCGLDGIEEVRLEDRPLDEPIRWQLHDARALRTQACGDALWLRLLDVPTALATRGYATRDRLVLDVRDDAPGGYGSCRVVLDADGAHAQCHRTDEAPDLRLDQRALAACYLGGHRLRAVSSGLPVEQVTPGAVQRFDALFATAWTPWTSTGF